MSILLPQQLSTLLSPLNPSLLWHAFAMVTISFNPNFLQRSAGNWD